MNNIEYSITFLEGGDNSVSGVHYRMIINTCGLTNRIIDILDIADVKLNQMNWIHKEYCYEKEDKPFDETNYGQVFTLEFKDYNTFNYFIYELDKAIDDIKKLELAYESEVV